MTGGIIMSQLPCNVKYLDVRPSFGCNPWATCLRASSPALVVEPLQGSSKVEVHVWAAVVVQAPHLLHIKKGNAA